jgi:catalase
MSKDEQNRLMDTIAGAMAGVPSEIIDRQIEYFMKADADYGVGIVNRLRNA